MDEKKDNVTEFADTPEEDKKTEKTSEVLIHQLPIHQLLIHQLTINLPLTMRQTTAWRKMTRIYMTTKRVTVKRTKKLRLNALK